MPTISILFFKTFLMPFLCIIAKQRNMFAEMQKKGVCQGKLLFYYSHFLWLPEPFEGIPQVGTPSLGNITRCRIIQTIMIPAIASRSLTFWGLFLFLFNSRLCLVVYIVNKLYNSHGSAVVDPLACLDYPEVSSVSISKSRGYV